MKILVAIWLTIGQPRVDKERVEKKNLSPTPTLYGEFKNISLTDEEYKKLQERLQEHTEIMINKLSRYIKSSGKAYKSHYATILSWYEEDKEKLSKKKDTKNNIKNKVPNYDNSPSI